MSDYKVTVLGAGLAGCEAALWLAGKGVQVDREALRSGSGASFDPTKNACPQWRTDVHFMPY